MKSGDVATPVDTLEAEVKRLEEAYANAISQVDKQKIARDKEVAENAANRAKILAEELEGMAWYRYQALEENQIASETKVSSTKKKKKKKKPKK